LSCDIEVVHVLVLRIELNHMRWIDFQALAVQGIGDFTMFWQMLQLVCLGNHAPAQLYCERRCTVLNASHRSLIIVPCVFYCLNTIV